jgi:hypothetical protein
VLLDGVRAVRCPRDLPLEPTIVDVAGVPVAYGAASGPRRWVRIPDLAELSWTGETDVLEITPFPDADPELVLDEVHAIGIPLFLHAARGYEALHASAVASASGVVGFCGTSGSGKSTIAHALALRGRRLWADDVLAFQVDPEKAVATALPFRLKLRPESTAFFRRRAGRKPAEGGAPETAVPWSTERLSTLFVLGPRGARASRGGLELEGLSAAGAMEALLAHGLRCKPLESERERRILTAYVDLVASVPVFSVKYQRGFASFRDLVDRVEAVMRALDTNAC